MRYNVAIDGPAGAGKSTVAKIVAQKLNLVYVDTGAMYRAVALKAIRHGQTSVKGIVEIAKNSDIVIIDNRVFIDGEDVTDEIRTIKVTEKVSEVAKIPQVRYFMLERQRKMAEKKGVIMDGRDIGTAVLPDAEYKFFLTADIKARARRRYEELVKKGEATELERVEEDILKRDRQDMERSYAPLAVARDAVIIDTTNKSVEEVVEEIVSHIKRGEKGAV
ncbi:(d)CMP kinase [Thermoanaerobacterium sp. DL9XJH110]|uniref:(d)CMP kinase n=1 Tax=Thermoanaerobacterium sp. DL9XJH110 TaxID=3386643 RepID=UPI003BB53C3C